MFRLVRVKTLFLKHNAKISIISRDPSREQCFFKYLLGTLGWSGGRKVLGKLPVPGRPTFGDSGRARVYCACNRCGWGLFGHFFSHLSLLLSFSLSLGDSRIKTEILSQRAVKPKTTNQPTIFRKPLYLSF